MENRGNVIVLAFSISGVRFGCRVYIAEMSIEILILEYIYSIVLRMNNKLYLYHAQQVQLWGCPNDFIYFSCCFSGDVKNIER